MIKIKYVHKVHINHPFVNEAPIDEAEKKKAKKQKDGGKGKETK